MSSIVTRFSIVKKPAKGPELTKATPFKSITVAKEVELESKNNSRLNTCITTLEGRLVKFAVRIAFKSPFQLKMKVMENHIVRLQSLITTL